MQVFPSVHTETLSRIGILAFVALVNKSVSAQTVYGILQDKTGQPLAYTPVALLQHADSTIIKGELSNETGRYQFNKVPAGQFLLLISAAGFQKTYSTPFTLDSTDKELPPMQIATADVSLDEVEVTTLKRTVEFSHGNITVNLEDSPLAIGNSAFDILQRMPGVTVTNEDIAIQGRSGTRIMIDGKLQQVGGAQLISLLKSISASSVQKIEIYKVPPVRFDASGTGGMINIVTRKARVYGFSGELNAEYSQGFYGTSFAGMTLNYKGKKLNFFSGITRRHEHYKYFNQGFFTTRLDSVETVIEQNLGIEEDAVYYPFNLGFDWFINSKNTIGIKYVGWIGKSIDTWGGTTTASDNSLGYRDLFWDSRQPNSWSYSDLNFNTEHLFDTTGSKLQFCIDYTSWFDIYDFHFRNLHYTDGVETLPALLVNTRNAVNLEVISSKLDYIKTYGELTIEAGAKAARQIISSSYKLDAFDHTTNTYKMDHTFTNEYAYRETIAAAYVNVSAEEDDLSYSFGLRAEDTEVLTSSHNTEFIYKRKYFNLFPLLNADYSINERHEISLSLNRRINRPDYNSLNPFPIFQNVLVFWGGNPLLRPEIASSGELTHTYKESLSNSVSYTHVRNVFSVAYLINDTNKTLKALLINLDRRHQVSYSLFIQKEFGKRVASTLKADASLLKYEGTFQGEPYHSSAFAWSASLDNTFLITNNTKLEANFYYEGPWLNGLILFKGRWFLDLGFKRAFLNDQLKVGVAVRDIFFTDLERVVYQYKDQTILSNNRYDSRRFNVSLTYLFGKLKIEQREVISNQEEKARTGR